MVGVFEAFLFEAPLTRPEDFTQLLANGISRLYDSLLCSQAKGVGQTGPIACFQIRWNWQFIMGFRCQARDADAVSELPNPKGGVQYASGGGIRDVPVSKRR